ncbi:hypothetical protein cypCar_00027256 [Cyprinus carpio]|nr:hypothetical protein cypCar_00027256 [Cyprinus carpio]
MIDACDKRSILGSRATDRMSVADFLREAEALRRLLFKEERAAGPRALTELRDHMNAQLRADSRTNFPRLCLWFIFHCNVCSCCSVQSQKSQSDCSAGLPSPRYSLTAVNRLFEPVIRSAKRTAEVT